LTDGWARRIEEIGDFGFLGMLEDFSYTNLYFIPYHDAASSTPNCLGPGADKANEGTGVVGRAGDEQQEVDCHQANPGKNMIWSDPLFKVAKRNLLSPSRCSVVDFLKPRALSRTLGGGVDEWLELICRWISKTKKKKRKK